MQLLNKIKLLRKNPTFLLVGVLGLLATGLLLKSIPKKSVYISTINSDPAQISSTLPNPINQTSNLANKSSFPSSIKAYKQSLSRTSMSQAKIIASDLGYESIKIQNLSLIGKKPKSTLIINTKTNSISYTKPLPTITNNTSMSELKQIAIKEASQFTQNSFIWKDWISIDSQKTDTYTNSFITVFDFFPRVEGYRVISSTNYPIGEEGVIKVIFYHHSKNYSFIIKPLEIENSPRNISLNTISQLSDKLLQGTATTTSIQKSGVNSKYYETTPISDVANFTDYELVYYFDTNLPNNHLTPMIIVSGNTTLKDGSSGTIKSILPASN